MAHSKSHLNWKTLKWLCRQEESISKSTTEVVRTFSNTKEIINLINEKRVQEQVTWEDLCVLLDLVVIVLVHAQSGSDVADEALCKLILSEENDVLKFVVCALQIKCNSRY